MSGFSADWLSLREAADARARAADLIARAGADLKTQGEAPLVCDLGSGTGAGMRAFAPAFPPDTRWLLTDNDPDTLAIAAKGDPGVMTRLVDLAQRATFWPDDCTLVTATALFDLGAVSWIGDLVAQLAAQRLPLLACLTYDGRLGFSPAHPFDADMAAAFNRHQRHDKGLGGPAAGPGAVAALAKALRAHGYVVHQRSSAWRLTQADDAPLIAALVTGWAEAMAEADLLPRDSADTWCRARLEHTDRLTIGHTDVYATPPEA